MSASAEKTVLKPGEKRLLVVVGIVVFGVLNIMFVFPRFGEFGTVRRETGVVQRDIDRYQQEIARRDTYQKLLTELEGQGSQVIRRDQALKLQMTVQSHALRSGVQIVRYDPAARSALAATNSFFDEQSIVVGYDTGYNQLINFLVGLTEDDSMIRVRTMDVRRDPSNQRLQGNITLVASYQKSEKDGVAGPQ
ncbi:MAG TPA: hypothetical protein DCY13_17825 [Verrucomicrobiales bacterium]|nr:hypothetical protein [Verrucomicrobiales bacterium]